MREAALEVETLPESAGLAGAKISRFDLPFEASLEELGLVRLLYSVKACLNNATNIKANIKLTAL